MTAREEHRRAEDAAGLAPVGRDELGDVARAETLLSLEVGAEAEVEDAFVDDRVHRRLLGSGTDRAERAAGSAHRLEQADVDDVARLRGPAGHAVTGRRRIAAIAAGSAARTGPGAGSISKPAAVSSTPRDVAPEAAVQRIERVAFGDGDLGDDVDVARSHAVDVRRSIAPASPRRRQPGRPRARAGRPVPRDPRVATAWRPPRSCPRARRSRAGRRAGRRRPARDHPRRTAGATTPGVNDRPAQVAASTDATIVGEPPTGARLGVTSGRRRVRPPSGSHQPRSRASRSSRGTTTPPDECRRLGRMRLGRHLRRVDAGTRRSGVDEPLRQRRLPEARPVRRPSLAPRRRDRGRHLAMRAGQPDQAPRPRHDAVDVVAAATGRQPATARVPVRDRVDQPRRLAHRGRRHAQVRERVPGVRIGAVLRHDEVRPERGGQLGHDRTRTAASQAPSPHVRAGAARSPPSRPRPPRPAPPPRPSPGTGSGRSRGTTPSARPDRGQWIAWTPSPWWTSRSTYSTRSPSRRARAIASAGRRRCRTPTPGRASRGAARRPGGRRARHRRAGSPRAPGACRRRPSPRPRASRRTAARRRPRRSRPPASRTDPRENRRTTSR